MPCRPALPAAALPAATALALSVLLAACSSAGTYPSLAHRPAERVSGSAEPVVAQPSQAVAVPAPASAALVDRLAGLVAAAREADSLFAARRARAEQLVGGAGGVASESWSVASVALGEMEAARSRAMIALADLDALYTAERIAHPDALSADGAAIAGARDTVSALVAAQDRVLLGLRRRLGV